MNDCILININNGLHIHEVNHDPLMIIKNNVGELFLIKTFRKDFGNIFSFR